MTPAQSRISEWRHDPVKFAWDNFNIELDEWQKDALTYVGGEMCARRRLTMKACTGSGKSTVLSIIAWHRLTCFAEKGEHPKGAALSGEGRDNLKANLWAELAKWRERSEFLKTAFTWTSEKIYATEHPATWFLGARSFASDADQEAIGRALSGLHSKYPFVLLDETGDMPITLGQKATQIFTGGVVDGLIAQAGNPTSTTGLLYHSSTHERDITKVITITADPDDPKRTSRVPIDHAREQIKLYGRDNPWVQATILGEFPAVGFNTLISVDEVEASMKRHITEDKFQYSQKRLGVDVARFGDDKSCIFPRQGLMAFRPVEMRGLNSNDVAARVMQAKAKWGSELELIDGTGGYGAGVIDQLMTAGFNPIEVQFAGKATDPRYANKRAEMWLSMVDWIRRGGVLPKSDILIKELTAPTYTFSNGRFLLEPKEQIKKRLGFSPDLADALACTFAIPDMPSNTHPVHMYAPTNKCGGTDVDPFRES